MKAVNVLLAVALGAGVLYELSRARFLADIKVRVVGCSITGPLSLNITLEFINPSNVSATINTIFANVNVNGYSIAAFNNTDAFQISQGISRKTLLGNIDPFNLISLGLSSLKSLRRPIVAKVDGYAIGGTIKFPFSQTVNV